MPTDNEIARSAKPRPIGEIAENLGLNSDQWRPYGPTIAKVNPGRWILTNKVEPSGEKVAPANSEVL